MKTMFFAAAATLLVMSGVAQAQQIAAEAPAIVVVAKHRQTHAMASPVRNENPTGLPAYELRPNGLLINGLLPAQGWEG